MKKRFALFCLLINSFWGLNQEHTLNIYAWEQVKNENPDSIYGLTLSKLKLEQLPEELAKFTNLEYLDVSKNKLTELPSFVGDFKNLKVLDFSKNEFAIFPVEICKLTQLQQIAANRNTFDQLPTCIQYCTDLISIDLWETPVSTFPESMLLMKNLKRIDLRGVRYGPTFHKDIQAKFPWIVFLLDPPCDCMK
jgi:hypothetical protein